MNNNKIYMMKFSKIYECLVSKVERKGRTKEEVNEIICWLTGYKEEDIRNMIEKEIEYGDFFRNAPKLNEKRFLIKGVVCGVKVEGIDDPLMRDIRYLDKLIDELAKGKSIENILRK